jgi:hypothetical protein
MIRRRDIRDASMEFTDRTGITLSPRAITLLKTMLNAVLYEPKSRVLLPERRARVLSFVRNDLAYLLAEISKTQRVTEELRALDLLHWLIREWPERLRSNQHLAFVFDKE